MCNNMLKNIYAAAVKNNEYFRSDGTAMAVVNIILNNYKIDIDNPDFESLSEESCLTIIFQIIVELRRSWSVALEFYQENSARDCKNLLQDINQVEGVYELEDRMVDIEMNEKEYEWYKQTYGLM